MNTELKQAITAKKKAVENLNCVVSQHESNIHALGKKLRAHRLTNSMGVCRSSQQ